MFRATGMNDFLIFIETGELPNSLQRFLRLLSRLLLLFGSDDGSRVLLFLLDLFT